MTHESIITSDHMNLAKEIFGTLSEAMNPDDTMKVAICIVAVVATKTTTPIAVVENAIATLAQLHPTLRGPLVKAVLDTLADHMEPGDAH